jgi:ABC-type nickel/cobalt efflux system permease component RcnA
MMKLLITSVTRYIPQNRVSNTIMHVTLSIINGVLHACGYDVSKFILSSFPSPL